jgi:hypothetical protein
MFEYNRKQFISIIKKNNKNNLLFCSLFTSFIWKIIRFDAIQVFFFWRNVKRNFKTRFIHLQVNLSGQ